MNYQMTMDQLFALFGQAVAYGGGGVALGFLLFKWLGQKWIENRFEMKLAQLEHDGNVVIARMKVEIDSRLSGVLKIQEREFIVLPESWSLLRVAYDHVALFVAPLQTVVDIFSMDETELAEYVNGLEWSKHQKSLVINAHRPQERVKIFTDIDNMYKCAEVKRHFHGFQKYIATNAIFYPSELKEALDLMARTLWRAITTKDIANSGNDFSGHGKAADLMQKDGEAERLIGEIEAVIRSRLESHMRAASK